MRTSVGTILNKEGGRKGRDGGRWGQQRRCRVSSRFSTPRTSAGRGRFFAKEDFLLICGYFFTCKCILIWVRFFCEQLRGRVLTWTNSVSTQSRCGGGVTARLCRPGARSGLPCPVPACCCRGRLTRAGSGSHSGVELWRSRTGKGSSGGRKKGVV